MEEENKCKIVEDVENTLSNWQSLLGRQRLCRQGLTQCDRIPLSQEGTPDEWTHPPSVRDFTVKFRTSRFGIQFYAQGYKNHTHTYM